LKATRQYCLQKELRHQVWAHKYCESTQRQINSLCAWRDWYNDCSSSWRSECSSLALLLHFVRPRSMNQFVAKRRLKSKSDKNKFREILQICCIGDGI